jgi:hypothetical protein
MVPMQLIVFIVSATLDSTSGSAENPENANDDAGFPAM